MRGMINIMLLGFIFQCAKLSAQPCTALGQNPQTAFPVCGTAVFNQSSVGICGNVAVPSACPGVVFTDKNPYWYKFTCFQSGTLGFIITPNDLSSDYDWQLFDVTGRNVADVYTDVNMFVACNWSGDPGITGASAAGTSLVRCEGPGVPLFSSMPLITIGREYLLLVSHFTDSQSGYSLSFEGGTASITDPKEPHLETAAAACDGTVLTIKLNKKMKCRTLASNGSDFVINTSITSIISAVGNACSSGFDTDSVTLTLSNPLPPGNYIVSAVNGTDGNTMLDNCDRPIPNGEQIPLTVFPIVSTPMDSLTKPGCSPSTLELVFRKNIRCNSIAANGSDFSITGSYPVSVIGASGNCSASGLTQKITVQLSAPLQVSGNFQIILNRGSDGNTLIDECGQESTPNQRISFSVKDTVNADFTFNITLGCDKNVVQYFHNGANGVNSWSWTFGTPPSSSNQNPLVTYSQFVPQQTTLVVSNGTCRDTIKKTIPLNNLLIAGFSGPEFVCPNDRAAFRDTSIGNIRRYEWDFGNGITSSVANPPSQNYVQQNYSYDVRVRLIVTNNLGCKDTAYKTVKIVTNCFIDVPSAFTPNRDGLNDFLYPLNAYKARDLKFSVYNRFGQRLFYSENWLQKWDGYHRGKPADSGTYVWMLQYTNTDTNQPVFKKGTVILIR